MPPVVARLFGEPGGCRQKRRARGSGRTRLGHTGEPLAWPGFFSVVTRGRRFVFWDVRPTEPETKELIRRIRAGEELAFETLVAAWDRPLLELGFRILGHRQDAEDVRQAAWIRFARSLDSLESVGSLAAWFYRIVVNLCRDQRRRRRPAAGFDGVSDPTTATSPREDLERAEEGDQVARAVLALPERERECVVLRHFHDLSISDIARIVGRPRTTVQSCLSRGICRLTQALRPHQRIEDCETTP